MTDQCRLIDYHYIRVDGGVAEAASIVEALRESGINLLAFSGFPDGAAGSQVDLIPESAGALAQMAEGMNLSLSKKKSGFLIRGEDRPGAIAGILARLAQEGIHVTAMQAITAGDGRYGALVFVEPPDLDRAALTLCAIENQSEEDEVDVSSEGSFPASDAPAWVGRG